MSNPYDWYPGQRVVCIKRIYPSIYREAFPSVGKTYTIREARPFTKIDGVNDGIGILLREITNKENNYQHGHTEAYFSISCFRPIEPKALEEFRKIAQDVTNKVKGKVPVNI